MSEKLLSHALKPPSGWTMAFISFIFGIGMAWGILGVKIQNLEQRLNIVEPKVLLIDRLDERTEEMNKKLDLLLKNTIGTR